MGPNTRPDATGDRDGHVSGQERRQYLAGRLQAIGAFVGGRIGDEFAEAADLLTQDAANRPPATQAPAPPSPTHDPPPGHPTE
jgi:hypothetical protein